MASWRRSRLAIWAALLNEADLKPHTASATGSMPRKRTTPVSPAVSSWSAPTYAASMPPDLYHQFGTHTVSTDEMTGIQALERIAETKDTKPGQEARMEFEYKRWGTQTLISVTFM